MSVSVLNTVDLLHKARLLADCGRPHALVTVVRAQPPTSAYVGAQAIVESDGTLHGWIGGGCAKGIVLKCAQDAIRTGVPRLVRISNDGTMEDPGVEVHAMPCASNGTIELFIQPIIQAPLLLVMGSTPAAMEICVFAQRVGLRVAATARDTASMADPEPVHVIEGFDAEAIAALQPSFVVVATQGDNDEAALEGALRSPAAAVLLIASRRKSEKLRRAMQLRGITDTQLARLHAPAGPDIHAQTPAEIALAAVAGVIAVRRSDAGQADLAPREMGPAPPPAAGVEAATYRNPVCGMAVDPACAKHVIDYGGEKHYFCCDGCKIEFERDPAKYAAIARKAAAEAT